MDFKRFLVVLLAILFCFSFLGGSYVSAAATAVAIGAGVALALGGLYALTAGTTYARGMSNGDIGTLNDFRTTFNTYGTDLFYTPPAGTFYTEDLVVDMIEIGFKFSSDVQHSFDVSISEVTQFYEILWRKVYFRNLELDTQTNTLRLKADATFLTETDLKIAQDMIKAYNDAVVKTGNPLQVTYDSTRYNLMFPYDTYKQTEDNIYSILPTYTGSVGEDGMVTKHTTVFKPEVVPFFDSQGYFYKPANIFEPFSLVSSKADYFEGAKNFISRYSGYSSSTPYFNYRYAIYPYFFIEGKLYILNNFLLRINDGASGFRYRYLLYTPYGAYDHLANLSPTSFDYNNSSSLNPYQPSDLDISLSFDCSPDGTFINFENKQTFSLADGTGSLIKILCETGHILIDKTLSSDYDLSVTSNTIISDASKTESYLPVFTGSLKDDYFYNVNDHSDVIQLSDLNTYKDSISNSGWIMLMSKVTAYDTVTVNPASTTDVHLPVSTIDQAAQDIIASGIDTNPAIDFGVTLTPEGDLADLDVTVGGTPVSTGTGEGVNDEPLVYVPDVGWINTKTGDVVKPDTATDTPGATDTTQEVDIDKILNTFPEMMPSLAPEQSYPLYEQCKKIILNIWNYDDHNIPPDFRFYYDSNGDGTAEVYDVLNLNVLETVINNDNLVDKSLIPFEIKVIDLIRYLLAIFIYGAFSMRLIKRLPVYYGNTGGLL